MLKSALPLVVLLAACAPAPPPPADLVLDGVSVLDLESGSWAEDRAVYVADGRVTGIREAGGPLPEGAEIVPGEGRFVIPGLWDAHVHSVSNRDWHFPLMLAHGVTAVRNMHTSEADPLGSIEEVRQEIRGAIVPPLRFLANGPIVDGDPSFWPGSIVLSDPARARAVVDSLADAGADFIKIYDNVSPAVFDALMEAARDRGVAVDGHVPFQVPMRVAGRAGMRTVEHLSGLVQGCSSEAAAVGAEFVRFVEGPELPFPRGDSLYLSLIRRLSDTEDAALCEELVRVYAEVGIAATPTLVNGASQADPAGAMAADAGAAVLPSELRSRWEMMAGPGPGQLLSEITAPVSARAPHLIRTLRDAGVPILVGTDVGNPFVVPGSSVHRELELLVEAGLSPIEALRAGTRTPAGVFGLADSLGLVRPGYVADLVVLDEDPLSDIRATRSISAVVLRGRLYDRAALDGLLADVAAGDGR